MSKPKVDRTKYMIQDKKNETIIKKTGEVDGFNFKIRNIDNCTIYLLDWTKGMFIDDCTNCKIVVGPCDGALFVRTSKNCTISTVCKQLRFRDCQDLKIFTYCPSDPVVENSCKIQFAPFNAFFPYLKDLFIKGGFNPKGKNINDEIHWGLLKEDDWHLTEIKSSDIGNEDGILTEPLYDTYINEIYQIFPQKISINEGLEVKSEPVKMEAIDIEVINEDKIIENEIKTNDRADKKNDIYDDDSVKFNVIPDFNNYNRGVDSVFANEQPQINFDHHRPNPVEISNIPKITNQNEFDLSNFNQPGISQMESNPFDFQMITQPKTSSDLSTPVVISEISNQNQSASVSPQSEFKQIHNINDDIIVVDSSPSTIQSQEPKSSNTINIQDFIMVNSFNVIPNFSSEKVQVINNLYNEGDDEETIAFRKRQLEHEERQRVVRMRIEQELREKSEMRLKASEYLNRFNAERIRMRENNLKKNKIEEQNYLESKKSSKNNNPWKNVISLVELKESNYKGTKDVNRMRQVMINRKSDFDKKNN